MWGAVAGLLTRGGLSVRVSPSGVCVWRVCSYKLDWSDPSRRVVWCGVVHSVQLVVFYLA